MVTSVRPFGVRSDLNWTSSQSPSRIRRPDAGTVAPLLSRSRSTPAVENDSHHCVTLVQNPFDHLYRDHDVEGMTDGYDAPTAYGHIDGIDDPTMGWSRNAQVCCTRLG